MYSTTLRAKYMTIKTNGSKGYKPIRNQRIDNAQSYLNNYILLHFKTSSSVAGGLSFFISLPVFLTSQNVNWERSQGNKPLPLGKLEKMLHIFENYIY